ncbi:HTTM domain-containing protein [Halorubrum californiense DSM 19288]|uniref:HTTM domain-containing protein n=1 Tax=Halorubrum californiense DSM 19288 TaxID=1227465 RepID=M0ED66_9EURY|nr:MULTISPECIES: HTTM domain-containing protein [Halorubrum]ELZ45695.1 HTTM domain-containing protein [Halorubrum californiense DSM 19288]TKX72259.1 HTTM domain-containing protein [Halorubrum sp. GN11GM_10-3_MGM]
MPRSLSVATVRSGFSTVVGRLSAVIAARSSVDLRALAAFRIGLGTLLIADLLRRSRSLTAFYTDAGVLPRRALFADYSGVYSLHALSGEPWAVASLFAVAGAVALALAVGYRTRLATVVSWLLLLSLQVRNPMVLNAGDALLAMLLFWGAFLPLGARWSVDAIRRAGNENPGDDVEDEQSSETGPSAGGPREAAVATAASLGVLLQMLVMYVTNGVHKLEGDLWMGGEAVAYVMQADQFTYLLGDHVAAFPALLRAATYVWVALLFASPLLIVLTGFPRAAVASLFVGTHLGMAVTMRIDLFPVISVVGFVPFYQTPVWDAAERAVDRFGPTAAIDRWRERLESAGRTVASLAASLPRPTQKDRLGGLADGVRAGAERGRPLFSAVIPALFVALIVLSSAQSVGYGEVPDPGEEVLEAVEMDQHWQMFAPEPVRTTRWFAAPGVLENGSERDVLHDGAVSMDRPPDVDATYPSSRWRKYLSNVYSGDNENHRSYLAHYLCAEWNRTHATDVETVTVYQLYERTDPHNGSVVAANEFELIEYDCSGEFVQNE